MNTLSKILENQIKSVEREIPRLVTTVANTSVDFFKQNFNKSGFDDDTVLKWRKRKRQYKHPILWKTGRLRRSIRVFRKTSTEAYLLSDLEYSAVHNYGSERMPQRKFIGVSSNLNKKVVKIITDRINRRLGV